MQEKLFVYFLDFACVCQKRMLKRNIRKRGFIMTSALFITVVGMLAVFAFLAVLMWSIELMSFCIAKTDKQTEQMDKIAAVIGIALQGEKK